MILYPSQFSLLQALISADYFCNQKEELAKPFDDFAESIFKNRAFDNQVKWLVDNGLISDKGTITQKGRIFCAVNPAHLSGRELSIRTNQFLFEGLKRNTLASCFEHMTEDTFLEVATLVNNEMEARYPKQIAEFKNVESFTELVTVLEDQSAVEDHILMVQAPVEVVANNEVMTEQEYEAQEVVEKVSVKKSRKKSA